MRPHIYCNNYHSQLQSINIVLSCYCVDPHVFLQGARLRKCLVTILAVVWFLPCVGPHMYLQDARLRKCLLTFLTVVWFLPCVVSSCGSSGCQIEKMFAYIPCRDYGFSPVWILMCIFRWPD